MAFRVVKQDMWTDEKVLDKYSAEDKYFWLYLLTNPQCNQLGIYKMPVKIASFQLGYSREQVLVLLERFEKTLDQIKYNYDTQEIAIGNYLYHSVISGGKPVFDAALKDASKISDKSLFAYVLQKLDKKDVQNKTVKSVCRMLAEKCGYTSPNDNDNDNDNVESSTNRPRIANESSTNRAKKDGPDKPAPIIQIILNDKSFFPVYQSDIDSWAALYPAVDILQELRKMAGWCDANPVKRKTKAGIKRFINSWLAREQDKGHGATPPPKADPSKFDFGENL